MVFFSLQKGDRDGVQGWEGREESPFCLTPSLQYIPLANRVRGPYCKLRTEFFPVRLNRREKNEDPKLTVRTEKTRLVRYLHP